MGLAAPIARYGYAAVFAGRLFEGGMEPLRAGYAARVFAAWPTLDARRARAGLDQALISPSW